MSRLAVLAVIIGVGGVGACGGGSDTITTPVTREVAIVSGNHQSGRMGKALSIPLTIAATTSDGRAVVNVTVNWSVTTGGGTLSNASVRTDNQGQASATWTLGNAAGDQAVAATVTGIDGSPVLSFSAFATAPPVVIHFDGTSWTAALEDANGAHIALASIWGAGADIFAVGSSCSGSLVLRYDRSGWDNPPGCGACCGFNVSPSVWGSSASDVFTVDRNDYPPSVTTIIRHFDGQQWNPVYTRQCSFLSPSPAGSSCNDYLDAVWSSSSTDAFAVGGAGTIKHFDGTNWTPQASVTPNELRAVWGTGPSGNVFAVGDGGTIVFFDGSTSVAQTSGTSRPLYAVWGTSSSDVFAVGAAGTILHYDGASWTAQASGSTQTLRGVWGSSGNAVFAVGDNSTIVHYDGTKWTAQTTSADINLAGIWGTSPTNVFAVGTPR
jgi:hypothetical protein